MKINFTKMEGLGNDYIYIDCTENEFPHEEAVARRLSDRHFGIGGDGMILIKKSDIADFEMVMYNADGSRSEMCGNGIRCVAKYVYDKGLTDKEEFTIESMGKIKDITLVVIDGKAEFVRVGMGEPQFVPEQIPVLADGDDAMNVPVTADGKEYKINCVSMGNPHGVIFVDKITDYLVLEVGKQLEVNPIFPNRANIEFARIIDKNTIEMRVWERGTGETLACGTGACATAAAAMKNNLTDDTVTVKLLGGDLKIHRDENNQIIMTGPASTVFDGTVEI